MDIKAAGIYGLGVISGVTGLNVAGGLCLLVIVSVARLAQKIFKQSDSPADGRNFENSVIFCLVTSIPLVGGLIAAKIINDRIKPNLNTLSKTT